MGGRAPASSTSVIGNNYHVFLSFRGPDTRNGFTHHLYCCLVEVGLHRPDYVLRDDENLRFGEPIAENLLGAIERSNVSIPVISETYAASEWCLRELIHIMKCKESRGQIVLPVLYKVDAYEVRQLKGAFGEAFRSRMHLFNDDVKQQGPVALRKALESRVFESERFAAGYVIYLLLTDPHRKKNFFLFIVLNPCFCGSINKFSSIELFDRREGELVKALVETIMRQQQYDFSPSLPMDLVGIDDQVTEVRKLVDTAYPDARIIVIHGISGIGKTTLASTIYNKLVDKFMSRSFLKDIRETINSKGIEHVQSRLISDLLKFRDYQVPDSHAGIRAIRSSSKGKKVLILLDDVDRKDHLDSLIGGCSFKAGSRIIITCRDKATLESKYGYEVKEMDREDSLLLFSRYAFGGEPRSKDLTALSREIVATTGGLPLALMVMGSLLKGKEDQIVWNKMLKKLRKAPNTTIQQKLRMSYDTLEHEEQQMFLDIACFFVGTDKRIASYYWDDLMFFPISGLAKMFSRSLIKYNDNNELIMHDQLRDLGRSIARAADRKPWDCSRLWDEEAMAVLASEENRNIEALRLDKNGTSKFMEQKSFKRMPKLKFLHLSAVGFAGHWEGSLCELRWLKWESCPHSFKATSVHLENLLVFDLPGGKFRENWEGWGSIKMERLKVLNLSSCSDLKTTPKLSAFKSLEMLILENCENLEEIDPSIGDVKCLVSLNLRYCGSLKKLPAQLGELKELEELLIDKTDIQEIPPCIGSLKKLKMLSAVGCGLLTQIPSSISHLVNLSTLNLTTCKTLQELGSFKALGELRRLCLACCYRLKQIPSSIGEFEKLVELDLSYTRIKELPESTEKLKNLKILRIPHSEIEKLPSSIGKLESLQELDASGCHKLEGQILRDIGKLSFLQTLRLGNTKISQLPENFGELSSLDNLDLLHCRELESLPDPPPGLSSLQLTCQSNTLPSLSHLSHLKKLTLHCCMFLERIPELPSNIRNLHVWKCPKLKALPNLSNLRSLMELELLQCYGLMEFNGLEALESLTKLDVSTSTELPNLHDFEDLESWTNLDLQSYDGEADNLHELRGIGQLKSLEVLNISARKHIRQLDLSKSEHLKQLIVNNCESLDVIHCHDKIESLEHFDCNGCKPLTILPRPFRYDSRKKQQDAPGSGRNYSSK
ncbi:hypothetical protein BT93_C0234 [Corymbia citriodora subsp. variegata]|nr:hypothetical protein BT93_C0234 [Corymbia citriodora subsp. variegata]